MTASYNGSTGNDVFNAYSVNGIWDDWTIYGWAGNDTLTDGLGNDYLDGGTGNDTLTVREGNDTLIGGSGFDTAAYSGRYFDYETTFLSDGRIQIRYKVTSKGDGTDILSEIEQITFSGGGAYRVVTGGIGNDNLSAQGTYWSLLFGGDGNDNLFGGNGNDTLFGGGGSDSLYGGRGDDVLYGGAGDLLVGDAGNNTFIATEASMIIGGSNNDILIADYSQATYSSGISLGTGRAYGVDSINVRSSYAQLLKYDGIEQLNITGTQYDDSLIGGLGADTLRGGGGNDTLDGSSGMDVIDGGSGNDVLIDTEGSVSGGLDNDILIANYSQYYRPYGVRLGLNGESTIRRRDDNSVILTFDGIEKLNVTGTQFTDYLVGQNGNDTLSGVAGHDILDGGNGDDILDGGSGNDSLIGGAGNDLLDGGSGDDSLIGGAGNDQLFDVSGSDTLQGGTGDDYLYAIADVEGKTKDLYGNEGSDTFVLDVKGEINLGFDFNVSKLADFVNAITLPENQGPDWQQLGTDAAFSALGAIVGSIPGVGAYAGFLTSLAQTGVNAYFDQQQLQEDINTQKAKANQAVKEYGTKDWGSVFTSGTRDTINIQDFQVGLDNIVLPQLPDANHFYQADLVTGRQGGVFLSIRRNTATEQFKNIAFIANNYTNVGITDQQFQGIIQDLIQGSTIGTFTKTPIIGNNNTDNVTETLSGTFARDDIQANGGDDQVFGNYGGDVIQGGAGNDTIFGGTNQNSSYAIYESVSRYTNDGNDILSGGAGNDFLYGESGNDFLNGGEGDDSLFGGFKEVASPLPAFNYSNDGNDTLNGGLGNDKLYGGSGNDLLDGGGKDLLNDGNDYLDGGVGDDTLLGGSGTDTLLGGAGNDTLTDTQGNLDGGTGTDTLIADYRQLNSGAGIDQGYLGNNVIYSRLNEQELLSYNNIEKFNITGTQFADVFRGGANADTFTGGAGNDTYFVNNAGDLITEAANAGIDSVFASINYTLTANVENLTLTGNARSGTGNSLNNTITGSSNNDTLNGGAGNDTLLGGAGNDSLLGGTGNDILNAYGGGNEVDSLTGGAGADTFILGNTTNVFYTYAGLSSGNIDYAVITAFNIAENDKIQLRGSVSNYSLTSGTGYGSTRIADTFLYNTSNGSTNLVAVIADTANLNLISSSFATNLNLTSSSFVYV